MADRRKHKRAPARGQVTVRAGGGRESRKPRTRRSWGSILRGLAWLFGPPVASALLLTLAFPPAEISWLAYVALVPLLVTAVRARTGRDAFAAALVGGVVFFGVNAYWIQPITMAGYLAVLPYLALYWAVWASAMRWLERRRTVPLALAAPVVWVALEWIRGWALSGLPWLFVGHTQYENLVLIQTADVVGAYGPSALCLATTGLVAAVLVRPIFVPGESGEAPSSRDREVAGTSPGSSDTHQADTSPRDDDTRHLTMAARSDGAVRPRLSGMLLASALVVVAGWAVTVGYGAYRLAEVPTNGGPVVASVQTNVPQEIKLKARYEQIERLEAQMLQAQFDLTDEAVARAAEGGQTVDLVCWPETMVPGILNREFLEADIDRVIEQKDFRRTFHYLQNRSRQYWLDIQTKARQAGAPVLCGAHAVELQGAYRLPGGGFFTRGPRQNAAFLITPDDPRYRAAHRYAKAHLVPFGEYVPLKESWPWLHRALQVFTPYEYDHSLTPGAHDQPPFTIRWGKGDAGGEDEGGQGDAGREARFQVAICYEDAMAYRIREMVRAGPGDQSASRERERAGERTRNAERGRRNAQRNGNGTRRGSSVASLPQNDIQDRRPRKAVDFIVNISNDGWFMNGWFTKNGTLVQVLRHFSEGLAEWVGSMLPDNGSYELDQHLNLCVFRAVENRVPVVRSVNTGISAIIQSTGRITRVVEEDGRRRGVSGCLVGELVLDDRLAPYTVHGDAFAYACLLATAGLAAAVVVGRLHGRRKANDK